ncbi:MAG: ATP-binding cassette domain-containing protein [Helicobacteraceae bacterium]|jgi:macrolide transport system ATP-binding/permease protein|nr:ATP-binding cassette domain-containing protein [Helicobacteraceae bacterium]
MKMLELNGVKKLYGNKENSICVLKDISLTIDRGDFVAIVGQSGSGKSTLMNIIGCLDVPSQGSYKISGEETANMSGDRLAELRCRTFGFVFQRYNLLPDLSAKENIALPSIYYGLDRKTREKKSTKLLGDLGLIDRADNKPSQLSGGQQQRVSIARALMNGADVVLADEPTGALDSKSGESVMDIIKDLHKSGRTIILVTHDQKIASCANRIIEIKDGCVVSDVRREPNIYDQNTNAASCAKNNTGYFTRGLSECFRSSVKAVMGSKIRSLLTILSIIIGIVSIVSVMAVGSGSKEKIMERVKAVGTNTVTIFPGKSIGDKDADKIKTLKPSDADVLAKLGYVESASPIVSADGLITYKGVSLRSSLQGVSAEYLELSGKKLQSGRRFDALEVKNAASVVIIDANTKKALFDGRDPIGEIIIFNKRALKIIGVAAQEDVFGPPTSALEVLVPYSTAMYKITGNQEISAITIKISDEIDSHLAEDHLIKVVTALHGRKDFLTLNSDSVRKLVEDMMDIFTLLISSISFIALVVGGVGVMNIMLVSVTQRTKEIGIRMAIGAKRGNILSQFLTESVMLSLVGGAIGVLLTLALAFVFNSIVEDFKMTLTAGAIVAAFAFSSLIGVLFGYIPARNAAGLNPSVALGAD